MSIAKRDIQNAPYATNAEPAKISPLLRATNPAISCAAPPKTRASPSTGLNVRPSFPVLRSPVTIVVTPKPISPMTAGFAQPGGDAAGAGELECVAMSMLLAT